jgi:hypothetical protein
MLPQWWQSYICLSKLCWVVLRKGYIWIQAINKVHFLENLTYLDFVGAFPSHRLSSLFLLFSLSLSAVLVSISNGLVPGSALILSLLKLKCHIILKTIFRRSKRAEDGKSHHVNGDIHGRGAAK